MSAKLKSAMISKQIAALKSMGGNRTVEAGWFASDRYGTTKNSSEGIPVAKIARIQEFGATITRGETKIIIPSRPFMRLAWKQFSADRRDIQIRIARKMVDKELSATQGLEQIGAVLAGYIAGSIKNGGWQKNADSTVKRKGFDSPLRWSGHMFKSVNYKVN